MLRLFDWERGKHFTLGRHGVAFEYKLPSSTIQEKYDVNSFIFHETCLIYVTDDIKQIGYESHHKQQTTTINGFKLLPLYR